MKRNLWILLVLAYFSRLAWAEPVKMETSVTKADGLLIRISDINNDGNPDHWWYSVRDGEVLKIERDLDFDGTIDARQWTFLRDKTPGKFEKMLYQDVRTGKIFKIDYYDDVNFLEKRELATKDNEVVDVVIECHGQIMDKVQADFNGDGVPDLVLTFDKGVFVKADVVAEQVAGVNVEDIAAVNKWWQEKDAKQYQRYLTATKQFKQKQ